MKVTLRPPATTSPRAVGRAGPVMAAVEGSLVLATGAAGATLNLLSTEGVTTASRRATAPLLHPATASRVRTGRAEVRLLSLLTHIIRIRTADV